MPTDKTHIKIRTNIWYPDGTQIDVYARRLPGSDLYEVTDSGEALALVWLRSGKPALYANEMQVAARICWDWGMKWQDGEVVSPPLRIGGDLIPRPDLAVVYQDTLGAAAVNVARTAERIAREMDECNDGCPLPARLA